LSMAESGRDMYHMSPKFNASWVPTSYQDDPERQTWHTAGCYRRERRCSPLPLAPAGRQGDQALRG
jgi:hypothetical protein